MGDINSEKRNPTDLLFDSMGFNLDTLDTVSDDSVFHRERKHINIMKNITNNKLVGMKFNSLGYDVEVVEATSHYNSEKKKDFVYEKKAAPEGVVVVEFVGADGKKRQACGRISNDYIATVGRDGKYYPAKRSDVKIAFKITDQRNGKTFLKEVPSGDRSIRDRFAEVVKKK